MTLQKILLFATLALIVLMSLVALCTFVNDKKRAKAGADRIKEKTLLSMAAFFGALGAFVGRIIAHHKTDKIYFSIIIILSLVLQAALVVYLGYLAFLL